jgi:NAD(P)H-hydrate epimerase
MDGPVVGRCLTRAEVRRVDVRAVEEFGMLGLVLMENAGRGCADVLCRLGIDGPVVICCGLGNNAGDGFVLARHLDLRRHPVQVVVCGDPARLRGDAADNFRVLTRADVPIEVHGEQSDPEPLLRRMRGAHWLVDALLGTGALGAPRAPFDRAIELMNSQSCRKLAIDLPSGLDCDTGSPATPTFRADHTCTFVASKIGFLAAAARPFLGQLHVLDIGIPRRLLDEVLAAGSSPDEPHRATLT